MIDRYGLMLFIFIITMIVIFVFGSFSIESEKQEIAKIRSKENKVNITYIENTACITNKYGNMTCISEVEFKNGYCYVDSTTMTSVNSAMSCIPKEKVSKNND